MLGCSRSLESKGYETISEFIRHKPPAYVTFLPSIFFTLAVSNMEIRFIPKNHSEELSSEGLKALPDRLFDEMLEEFYEYDESIQLKELNYGLGADWIWVYAIIAGITHLIILGDKINSGFEGWEKLAKRILKFKKKCSHIALDKDAITSLCVYKILELRPNTKEIKKVIEFEREVPAGHGTMEKGTISDFIEKAQIYYMQGFEIDSKEFILIGSNIEGELEVLKHIHIEIKNQWGQTPMALP